MFQFFRKKDTLLSKNERTAADNRKPVRYTDLESKMIERGFIPLHMDDMTDDRLPELRTVHAVHIPSVNTLAWLRWIVHDGEIISTYLGEHARYYPTMADLDCTLVCEDYTHKYFVPSEFMKLTDEYTTRFQKIEGKSEINMDKASWCPSNGYFEYRSSNVARAEEATFRQCKIKLKPDKVNIYVENGQKTRKISIPYYNVRNCTVRFDSGRFLVSIATRDNSVVYDVSFVSLVPLSQHQTHFAHNVFAGIVKKRSAF